MRRLLKSRSARICVFLLAPMGVAIEVPMPDSLVTPEGELKRSSGGTTSLTFAGGGGTHFQKLMLPLGYSDCGGPQSTPIDLKDEFREIGLAIDHHPNSRLHFGLRGGYVWTDYSIVSGYDTTLTRRGENANFWHVDPYVAVDWTYFGFGLGGVFSSRPLPDGGIAEYPLDDDPSTLLSGHLRVGSLSSVYVNATAWEGVPLMSGGQVSGGIGIRPIPLFELYAGFMGEGPFMGDQWMGRITVDATPDWSFYLNMRFPKDWDGLGNEYATSFGATYHVHHEK